MSAADLKYSLWSTVREFTVLILHASLDQGKEHTNLFERKYYKI